MIESIPIPIHARQLEFPWITTAIATHFPVTETMWTRYKAIDGHIGDMAVLLALAQTNYDNALLDHRDFNTEVRLRD